MIEMYYVLLQYNTESPSITKKSYFLLHYEYIKRQPHKMVKHTQTIRTSFADQVLSSTGYIFEGRFSKLVTRVNKI